MGTEKPAVIPTPTADGGVEHTMARFLPAWKWLEMAGKGEVVLFPPQYYLLHLLKGLLAQEGGIGGIQKLRRQREEVMKFVRRGEPSWAEKCISPVAMRGRRKDGKVVLALEYPGQELEGSARRGDAERVVMLRFTKEGPRDVEVRWRKEIGEESQGSMDSRESKI